MQEKTETARQKQNELCQCVQNQPLLANSVKIFAKTAKWLTNETDRIQKQMMQFGYQPPTTDKNDTFNKPLTPEEAEKMGLFFFPFFFFF